MKLENFKIIRINDIEYKNIYISTLNNGVYTEIRYKRDRASFAGVGLKVIEQPNTFIINNIIESDLIQEVDKYDNLRIGLELDYIEGLKKAYHRSNVDYGIELFFLIYSDVRSCSIIFEELMECFCHRISSYKDYIHLYRK